MLDNDDNKDELPVNICWILRASYIPEDDDKKDTYFIYKCNTTELAKTIASNISNFDSLLLETSMESNLLR